MELSALLAQEGFFMNREGTVYPNFNDAWLDPTQEKESSPVLTTSPRKGWFTTTLDIYVEITPTDPQYSMLRKFFYNLPGVKEHFGPSD